MTIIDSQGPTLENLTETPADPATYSSGQAYNFTVDAVDLVLVDTVQLEFNGVNYTAAFDVNTTYYVNLTDLSASVHNYTWFANDTSGNLNQTSAQTYTVSQASGAVNLLLDGTDGNVTVEVGSTVNLTGSLTAGEDNIDLYEDGSSLASGASPLESLRTYNTLGNKNITLEYNATENYTAGSETHFVIVVDTTLPVVTLSAPANNTNIIISHISIKSHIKPNNLTLCWSYE